MKTRHVRDFTYLTFDPPPRFDFIGLPRVRGHPFTRQPPLRAGAVSFPSPFFSIFFRIR